MAPNAIEASGQSGSLSIHAGMAAIPLQRSNARPDGGPGHWRMVVTGFFAYHGLRISSDAFRNRVRMDE
jgi:hypothetical protein